MRRLRSNALGLVLAMLATSNLIAASELQGLTVPANSIASCSIGWTQDADSLATAQAGPYTATWDGGSPHGLATAKCSGTATPFACQATLLDLMGGGSQTIGPHTFTIATSAGVSVLTTITITGIGIPQNFRVILAAGLPTF
jgi:hypothetical protein